MRDVKVVSVAVAVIYNKKRDHVLLSQRIKGKHLENFWEFPGGKIEPIEQPKAALSRELNEELGITPIEFNALMVLPYEYPELKVILHVFNVFSYTGTEQAMENQPLRWVPCSDLFSYKLPAANKTIVSSILLPNRYLITSNTVNENQLVSEVEQGIGAGIMLIQLRAPKLSKHNYLSVAKHLSRICIEHGVTLMIKGELDWLEESWCQGMHLTSQQLSLLYQKNWEKMTCNWLAASCHNKTELMMAASIGCDFSTLSPVCPTLSHPERKALGYGVAHDLTVQASLPVYWLGGMRQIDLDHASAAGAQGIAGISYFLANQ